MLAAVLALGTVPVEATDFEKITEIKDDMLADREARIAEFEAQLKDEIDEKTSEFERQKEELLQKHF